MHGRIKVRTSEEEKARKAIERQKKLKVFKNVMQLILNKRQKEEFDKELLDLTGQILSTNPDIYTLWNIRRETLLILGKIDDEEEKKKLFDAELSLTEYCLKSNPKSYCAWHQREWVLTTCKNPDWKKELTLCDTYLKLDERNFHTWDYRRFVVNKYNPSLKEEFNFTTDKIHENFSNYSAWHYRSKLLVKLFPDLEGGRPIEDSHHKHELKMVQSAAFTDPDDTSAWFYLRWLLGAVKNTVHLVVSTVTPVKVTLAFNNHVSKEYVEANTNLFINNEVVKGDWFSCTGNSQDNLWILKHSVIIENNMLIEIKHTVSSEEQKTIVLQKFSPSMYVGRGKIDFKKKYSQPVVNELKSQLESCRQLLALEPDNKWTLLTTAVFLHCVDANSYYKEAVEILNALRITDKLRAGYYEDLITTWNIEQQLQIDYCNNDATFKLKHGNKITSLPHLQYYSYCENIDLSNQNLTSQILPSLICLQNCKKLNLANNKITSLKGFPALDLDELVLQGNCINKEDLKYLKKYNIIML